jgi:spore germination protein KB
MNTLSNLQLYCLLVLVTSPLGFLIAPMLVIHRHGRSAWLAMLAAVIPGALLVYILGYIVRISSHPFPKIYEVCLGKIVGKTIGLAYILMFLFTTSFTLAYFVALISSSIVPDTPLSVYIGAMLLVGYYALKTGLQNIARVAVVIIIFGLPLVFVLVTLGTFQNPDFSIVFPPQISSIGSFTTAVLHSFIVLGDIITILTLGFFAIDRSKLTGTLFKVLITFIILNTLTTAGVLMNFGPDLANLISFPTFKLVRSVTIGNFIQNIDVLFISLWIAGIMGSIMVKWFVLCFSIQEVFALRDFRFLAAPSSVVIGFVALMMGKNIVELQLIVHYLLPYLYSIFFVGLPLILYIILLFRTSRDQELPLDQ